MMTLESLAQQLATAKQLYSDLESELRTFTATADTLRRRIAEQQQTPLERHDGLADDQAQLEAVDLAMEQARAALGRAATERDRATAKHAQAEAAASHAVATLSRLLACEDADVVSLPIQAWRYWIHEHQQTALQLLGAQMPPFEIPARPPLVEQTIHG